MSDCTELPIHPRTGLRALGVLPSGRIVWPIFGASEDGGAGAGAGGAAAGAGAGADGGAGGAGGTETGHQGGDGTGKETETVEFWKGKARDQEKRAKSNADAADELAKLKESQKTQAEKDADKIKTAEAEVAAVPAKVAEALKVHLIARHEIDAEDAELFLTATDPDLLVKQVDRLLGQSDKSKRKNRVPGEGKNTKAETNSGLRDFARDLFGNNT